MEPLISPSPSPSTIPAPTPTPLPEQPSNMTPSSPDAKSAAAASQERRRSARVSRQAAAAAAASSSSNQPPDGNHSSTASSSSSSSSSKLLPKAMNGPRRNPKRKASETASQPINMPDNLLEEALRPLTAEDIQDWEGWVELESEPAFFNIILRDLGVKDVKAQEIFSIDQSSMEVLPKPVFGLIFLFQFDPGDEESESEDDADLVWFANQTTHNACATVALLNIVMNADKVELGDRLREFKNSTKHLSTALRGHHLSKNSFIRTIHNSFTRRMDHLNADLALQNEASSAEAVSNKRRAAKRGGKMKAARSKNKIVDDYGYHFIAYVPAGGFVWELDGLRSKPYRLGPIETQDSWTTIARPRIEDRIMKYEGSQLSFNLLALCNSPLAMHSRAIAQALAAMRHVRNQMKDRPEFASLIPSDDYSIPDMVEDATQLAEFNIDKSDIENEAMPDFMPCEISKLEVGDAHKLYQRLVANVNAAIGEFRAELVALAEDEMRVKGRKKDYGQALHKWVEKLAEKNVLEQVIKQSFVKP